MKKVLTNFSINHPFIVIGLTLLITIFFAIQFLDIKIDTDPENMLETDEPTRLFHQMTKDNFNLHDFIAVGVVKEDGVFTSEMLNRIYQITSEIENIEGIIVEDILAPSTVDDIKQGPSGDLVIKTLMDSPIETDEEARYILSRINESPILKGKLASQDGKAIALFIPLESKDVSNRVSEEIRTITEKYKGDETYHIAGLPLAENAFGDEMFMQMAFSAPLALLIIFLLMLMFFKKMKIVLAPMAVAMISVIWAMGLLIYTGNTVHIMSSMIPIFLIPISVLDSVHIISEIHDHFKRIKDKAATIRYAIDELFGPMLFTSLTTIAGFISFILTPIPPVKIFGIFVAFGISVAWILSLTIIPAITILVSDKSLKNFGRNENGNGLISKILNSFRSISFKYNKSIITISVFVIIISGFGLSMITVNDNPVKWFKKSHPIRQADMVMNQHLAGTYMNYLVFDSNDEDLMKDPEILNYMVKLQNELKKDDMVGATTGITDIVKKVRYELFGADSSQAVIPTTSSEVAQMLFLFEMSGGDPDDLFKFVTNDYTKANLWVQLKNGDNQKVQKVVDRATDFITANPPPGNFEINWAGLPYINIEWQKQMVTGMRSSLISSYLVVFIMMVFLFKSFRWGLISMLPLTITIIAIYAFIGFIGKPYDMPVAVLSSLTLGLSIDFAIHFIQRLKIIHARTKDFKESFHEIFESTGRAISRNVMVIAIGFIPMLFSTLVPYITVGSFFLAIMIVSGLVTMILLPAITKTFNKSLLKIKK